MSTEIHQDPPLPDVDTSTTANPLESSTSKSGGNEQFQEIWGKVSEVLAAPIDYLTDFFKNYRPYIIAVLVVASAAIAVRLTLAILGALNGIPLLPALLELIGLGYTAWFVYRYLWRAANRQELVENFNSLKDQVLGNKA
ncbi:MAG: CAAD domain-containing protein [Cyanobacteria bacterium P01_A01_bin.123]